MKILLIGKGVISTELFYLFHDLYDVWIYRRCANDEHEANIIDNLDRALFQTDIIISCVPDTQSSKTFWEDDRVQSYLANNRPLCIEMSTLEYSFALHLHNMFNALHCNYIEMPFTGSRDGARTGTMTLFMCSNFEITDEIKKLIEIMSTKQYVFTRPGNPTLFKLIFNLWGFTYLYFMREYLPLINRYFYDEEIVFSILQNTGWMSNVCKAKMETIINKTYNDITFSYKNAVKDIRYALENVQCDELPISKKIFEFIISNLDDKNCCMDYSIYADKDKGSIR